MSYDAGMRVGIDGEKEFKNQIDSMNTSIKTLNLETKAVTSSFIGQQESAESLSKTNEVLSRTVSALEEKLSIQQERLEKYKDAYGESDVATQKLQQDIYRTTAELNKAKAKINANEQAMRELAEGTDEAAESTSVFSDVLKADLLSEAIQAGIKAVASVIREIGQALADTVKDSAAYADNILTLATNTGIAAEMLQEYQYMAELTDTSLETITGSMAKLTRSMENAKNGTGDAAAAFAALGISVTDKLTGQLRDNEEVFGEVLDALGKMQNETQRDAYAMDIFGKSAQDLNSLIAAGKDGIAAFAKEAHDMGYVLDEETLASLSAVDDALQRLHNFMTMVKNTIGAALAPAVTELADSLQEWARSVDWEQVGADVAEVGGAIKDFVMFVVNNGSEILTIIAGVGAGFATWKVASLINTVVGAIKAFTIATDAAAVSQNALSAAIVANPIGAIVTVIMALVAALVTAYQTNDEFRAKVDAAWDAIKEKIKAVTDWIKARIQEVREFFGLEGGNVNLNISGSSSARNSNTITGGLSSFNVGGTVNNFKVDDIRTYQQIEQRAVNQQRTTRMSYVGW